MKPLEPPYSLHPDAQIFQGPEWAAFQEMSGNQTIRQEGQGWHWQAIVRSRRYGSYLDVPLGPTLQSAKSFEPAIAKLVEAGRAHDAVFVRFEPVGDVSADQCKAAGARPAEKDFQPKHTLVVDLTQPLVDIKAVLNKGRKGALNRAVKLGVTMEITDDPEQITEFLNMLHITYQRTGIQAHPDSYYKNTVAALAPLKASKLFYALHEGKRVAGVIAIDSPTTRYYMHAASYPEARELEAASLLVWQIMVDAKERALKKFDFYGIAPPDQPNHPWAGFSSFKKSFGGEVVERIGTWEMPLKPLEYRLLRTAKRVKKAI